MNNKTSRIKRRRKLGIQLYFIFLVLLVLAITIITTGMIVFLFDKIFEIILPGFIVAAIMSVTISLIITAHLNRRLLSPIAKLSKSMELIADGKFDIHIETKSKIGEIRRIYNNFNIMARELRSTEVLQNDFISNVSHEIKTPISAIEGYAMLLQYSNLSDDEENEYLCKILFNTHRLSELVGNILLLSKLDNQTIQNQRVSYRLDEQVRKALLMLEQKWTEKETEFDVDMEKIVYLGHESLLLHVWTNLIDNAVKFGPKGGLVKIRLKRFDNIIRFEIEDNGSGISEEDAKHIFDRFYQSDSSHKDEGNRLGLALVKRIIDICGGNIELKSSKGLGSKFTVYLPVYDEDQK